MCVCVCVRACVRACVYRPNVDVLYRCQTPSVSPFLLNKIASHSLVSSDN
jgi:hypothetical protein